MSKKIRVNRRDHIQFMKRRFFLLDWIDRASKFLERNMDKFIPDSEYESKLNREDWFMFNGIDASKKRYTEETLNQLKRLKEGSFADSIVTELRVEWAGEFLGKISRGGPK